MNIENYNIQQDLQEKFIKKLVLDYLSDVLLEYSILVQRKLFENTQKGDCLFYGEDISRLAKQAVENIRSKYES